MSNIRPIFLIAGNTITGTLRGVVLNVLLVLAALMIVASLSTSALDLTAARQMLVDSGLASITVLGALIAILTGFTMIPGEIESRTLYPVLSKPVRRWQFVLGKFFGAAGINAITVALLAVLFFTLYFIKIRDFDIRLLAAIGMIYGMLLVLSAIIIFLSTFMSWIGTIIVSSVIWFIGNYSQFLYDLGNYHSVNETSKLIFQTSQKLFPNFQAMDLRYDIVQLGVPAFEAQRILVPLGSAVIYLLIALLLAMLIFSYREL
jgi:ABC-type transport system involved in multi-copper enzyme maturation permease subunit